MRKETLIIRLRGDSFVADWSGTREAQSIRQLFGTAITPTPFTARADKAEVLRSIAELNPEYTVRFE